MSLKLENESMPITDQLTKKINLEDTWIIIIQHWVKDAINFALKLKNNSNANVLFLPKPFSKKEEDLNYWRENQLEIIETWDNYKDWLEKPWFLENKLTNFKNKNWNFLIEVWWISTVSLWEKELKNLEWIVEITTLWHNRHLEKKTNLITPIYSIARSPIKEAEAKHVWLAVYRSLDLALHELERDLTEAKITMVWYWMIWKSVCNAFKWRCKKINVYDINPERIKEAKWRFKANDQYSILVKDSDIIISSTWSEKSHPIDKDFIDKCKDWVLLVSAGSRQNEIDINYLEEKSENTEQIHKFIKKYVIWWKSIFVFREWKNANFAWSSCPEKSMDLIHAETLTCIKKILDWDFIKEEWLNTTIKKERQAILDAYKKFWK